MANKYTTRDLWEYNFDKNSDADYVNYNQLASNAENTVANYGDPKYARQQDIESAINAKLNQGKFSYDINGDVLYQQYKDNYINQGKQAMVDVMGQASAMTGGYGNSYAATVGNQTYQGYLTNLNNMIPQLQQMALDRYNAESNRLTENLNVLNADKANYLTEWQLGYNKAVADRNYYGERRDNAYKNALDSYNNQFTANNDAYWNEYNAGYKAEQDKIANANAAAQLKLQQDAQKIAELQAGVVRDKKGNIVSVAKPVVSAEDAVPSYIHKQLENAATVADVENILGNLNLDQDVYDELLATYEVGKEGYNRRQFDNAMKDITWTLKDAGGWNWGGGIDNNGKVSDGKTTYTMKQLKNLFMDKYGLSEDEAKEEVMKIQRATGVSQNR